MGERLLTRREARVWQLYVLLLTVLLIDTSEISSASQVVADGSNLLTEERDRFTIYQVTLPRLPSDVSANDFHINLIGTQFINITVDNTNVDWKIRLTQSIPSDIIFYPEYSATMERADGPMSTWIVKVRLPKVFDLSPVKVKKDEL
ncbi:hypothetical protein BgAZ_402610 [Babesia gibsoni]|uniref:Uncharacterized protein n=1 Tax=Babesia gibsoni TaxID=33632 RepID=A0AAD8PDJ4_BABGI|nr:hypothetical protein BgAZ_402610 [Babesia gibsoni]